MLVKHLDDVAKSVSEKKCQIKLSLLFYIRHKINASIRMDNYCIRNASAVEQTFRIALNFRYFINLLFLKWC